MEEDNAKNRLNKTTYKTKYPHNKVTITPSGHIIEIDDTPGASRIRIAHKSGSYTEMSEDGKVVNFTVGNRQEYHKGGCTVTIDENNDVKIAGHQRVNISGGQHVTIAGDADVAVGGSMHSVVMGNLNAAVGGDMYTGVKGNGKMNISGNMSMKVSGDTTMETGGTHTIKAAKVDINP